MGYKIKLNNDFEVDVVPGEDPLISLLEAVLIFYSNTNWDSIISTAWFNRTQRYEASTKVLCDVIRKVLSNKRNVHNEVS